MAYAGSSLMATDLIRSINEEPVVGALRAGHCEWPVTVRGDGALMCGVAVKNERSSGPGVMAAIASRQRKGPSIRVPYPNPRHCTPAVTSTTCILPPFPRSVVPASFWSTFPIVLFLGQHCPPKALTCLHHSVIRLFSFSAVLLDHHLVRSNSPMEV